MWGIVQLGTGVPADGSIVSASIDTAKLTYQAVSIVGSQHVCWAQSLASSHPMAHLLLANSDLTGYGSTRPPSLPL